MISCNIRGCDQKLKVPLKAYLLVSHGSRDPRPGVAMEQLVNLLTQRVSNHGVVGAAALELQPQPLHEKIRIFTEKARHLGCDQIQLVPIFLLPGVHVMEDIPAEVAKAESLLGEKQVIKITPYLGSHPRLSELLQTQVSSHPSVGKILLTHGSRRPQGNLPVETMAAKLGAIAAYWSVSPSLESQVTQLVASGCQEVAIITYFLFPGGITDAIASQQEALKLQFPEVRFHLTAPLGASPELADLIGDLTHT